MSIRSLEGVLLTLLFSFTALTLGIRLADLPDPSLGATEAVRGWRVVCAVGAAGIAAWTVLALVDGLLGRPMAVVVGLILLVLAPIRFVAWESTLWHRRGFVYAVRIDGRAGPAHEGSSWRGVLGIPCGQPTIFEITIGADGEGVGTAQNYWRVPSLALAVALAPLDGPYRMPLHSQVDGDSLRILGPGFEPYAIPIYPR